MMGETKEKYYGCIRFLDEEANKYLFSSFLNELLIEEQAKILDSNHNQSF